eukprot:COSAG01_NODE_4311_length_5142_cov_10.132263_4_plen_124_part_00
MAGQVWTKLPASEEAIVAALDAAKSRHELAGGGGTRPWLGLGPDCRRFANLLPAHSPAFQTLVCRSCVFAHTCFVLHFEHTLGEVVIVFLVSRIHGYRFSLCQGFLSKGDFIRIQVLLRVFSS